MTGSLGVVCALLLLLSKLLDRILIALLETLRPYDGLVLVLEGLVEGVVRFLRDRAGMVARSLSITTIASELCCSMSSDSKDVKKVSIVKSQVVVVLVV
jgi:hypothetical protein